MICNNATRETKGTLRDKREVAISIESLSHHFKTTSSRGSVSDRGNLLLSMRDCHVGRCPPRNDGVSESSLLSLISLMSLISLTFYQNSVFLFFKNIGKKKKRKMKTLLQRTISLSGCGSPTNCYPATPRNRRCGYGSQQPHPQWVG